MSQGLLCVAQVRMRIHEANFATKERRALRALEDALRAAVIRHRGVEQARAVRTGGLAPDDLEVRACLIRSQQVLEDRVDHCERAVVNAGGGITRMEKVADVPAGVEYGVAL